MLRSCLCLGFPAFLLLLASCSQSIPNADFDARKSAQTVRNLTFTNVRVNRKPSPELLKPTDDPYILGPGDILEIEISELPGSLSRTFVMPDGMVYYNLAGGVRAEGLTTREISQRLAKALEPDYVNPLVNVSLVEVQSRRFWILGRVFKPGLYALSQPTTLLEGISQAGGLFTSAFSGATEELADLSNSVVIRDGEVLPVNFEALIRKGDASQNIYLQHNDYVYLPSATSSTVLLLGAVVNPQAVGYKDSLTLIDCLAQGRGPTQGAYQKEVVIVRGSFDKPQVALVDLRKILTGKQTDVLLQPGDIVWIPRRPLQQLEDVVTLVFQDAARTMAAREGARVAGGEQDVGVTIPLSSPAAAPAGSP